MIKTNKGEKDATFIFAILVLGTWFMPLIIMITLILGIIECIKRLIKKEKIRKTITQVMTKILCEVLAMIIGYYLLTYEKAKPSDLYREMKIHHDSENLIGLSKEVVIELLGKPAYEETYRKNQKEYTYHAGSIRKEKLFGYNTDSYDIIIYFDEEDNVEVTSIQQCT